MELRIYTIYDSAIEAYRPPFMQRAKGEALRTFAAIANDPENIICAHPAHYTLFELGIWDDKTAKFTAHNAPIPLGLATEHKKAPQDQPTLWPNGEPVGKPNFDNFTNMRSR